MGILIETDSRSRVVLPGWPDQKFLMQVNEDGSILLEPARVISEAQFEYDTDEALQALLTRAASATTVRRQRQRRT